MGKRVLAISNQQVVEIWIGADDPGVSDARLEIGLRRAEAPNSMLSPKISASSAFAVLWWVKSNTLGHDTGSCQLTAGAYHGGDPELDLMAVRVAAHTDVVK